MSDVFDLDAVASEAKGDPFTFRWAGEEWTLPPVKSVDWRDARALERGEIEAAFPKLMGAEQFNRFATHRLDIDGLGKLVAAYMKHQGLTPGESEASPSS